jgi:hypothetical protein
MKARSSTSSSNPVGLLAWKTLALLAPFIAISAPPVVQTLAVMIEAEQSVTLRQGVFDSRLEGKWRALVTPETRVLVAGDSRAERQIIPSIIEAATGWSTANVATSAQDLVTLSNALARYGAPPSARVLIISASVFQINDGAIDEGYISAPCLLSMTTWERVGIYADRLGSPLSPLAFQFTEHPPAVIDQAHLDERGFVGSDRQLSLPLPKVLLNLHPWYRNQDLRGSRWRIFQEALGRIAASGLQIYLVQPPVSPAWRAYTSGTFVDDGEREYAGMLQTLAASYPNVQVLDYYTHPVPVLDDTMFYDVQHLNRTGSRLFTEMLVRDAGFGPGR